MTCVCIYIYVFIYGDGSIMGFAILNPRFDSEINLHSLYILQSLLDPHTLEMMMTVYMIMNIYDDTVRFYYIESMRL